MGIPQLFSRIVQDNPELIQAPIQARKQTHTFYLDYNALIYQVWHCIQGAEHPDARKAWGEAEWRAYLIEQVVEYTADLIAWVNPTHRAVICIDGPVPRAKIEQQRQRRFKLPWTRAYEKALFTNAKPANEDPQPMADGVRPVFDTAQITVGTPFWGAMVEALVQAVKKGQMTPQRRHNGGILPMNPDGMGQVTHVEIEIQDAQTRGEGEHKIISQLLAHPTKEQVLIYGLDADLLLLTLRASLVSPNLAILRESTSQRADQEAQTSRLPKWQTPFFWVDIPRFRGCWVQRVHTLAQEAASPRQQKNKQPPHKNQHQQQQQHQQFQPKQNPAQWTQESLIADAMVLYCFAGNDFLPQQPSVDIQEGGIDNLWRTYAQTRMMRAEPWSLVDTRRGEVRWDFLREWVKRLHFQEIHQCKYLQNRRRMKSRARRAMIDEATGLPILFGKGMSLDESRFQWEKIWGNEHLRACFEWTDWTHPQAMEQYHKFHFDWVPNQIQPEFYRSHMGQRACREYLRTLDFVFQYYWKENPCWEHYYPYPSTPLFHDLVKYLYGSANYKALSISPKTSSSLITPLGQGSWVLPPQYVRQLIPEIPATYRVPDFEAPEKTALHGADRYWLMVAEPILPPVRWVYWMKLLQRDGQKEGMELHPIRKFRIQVRS